MDDSGVQIENLTQYVCVKSSKSSCVSIFPHIHNHYEIYYNISGAKGYMVNGVFYKCSKRDLIIIPHLQSHKVVMDNGYAEYSRLIINIDKKLLSVLEAILLPGSVNWLVCENGFPKKTTLTEEQHEIFMQLLADYRHQTADEELLGIFGKILAFMRVCFSMGNFTEFLETDAISPTDRIMMIIEKNFRAVSVSQIAELSHYNSNHLNRLFKAETGITINHYLMLRKLTEAQKYLCMGKRVKEACSLSGFNNYSNFQRTFKKYLGCTPREFCERNK